MITSLDASLTATAGLRESSRTVDALSEGMNRSLEALAESGTSVKKEAIKTAYGPGIRAASVRKLVDSMVAFQTESVTAIKELRAESTKNADEIESIVDEGKRKFIQITTSAQAAQN